MVHFGEDLSKYTPLLVFEVPYRYSKKLGGRPALEFNTGGSVHNPIYDNEYLKDARTGKIKAVRVRVYEGD